MNRIIPILIIFTIICIVALQIIQRLFEIPENILLVRIIFIGISINVLIFVYLKSSFSVIKNKRGPLGPQGIMGDKGYEGTYDSCATCFPEPTTFGYEKNVDLKQNLVIPQKPLLTTLEFEETTDNLYRINNIFTNKVGCPMQIVNTEQEAIDLINIIKTNINKEPTDVDIQSYLQRIKHKADRGNSNEKRSNYPKCYGADFVSETSQRTNNRYDTKMINPYGHSKEVLLSIVGTKFSNECPPGHYLKEIHVSKGNILDDIYGKCTDGSILEKRRDANIGGSFAKKTINKQSTLDVYTSNSEHKWVKRISGIDTLKGTDSGAMQTLKCNKNDDVIVGFNYYYNSNDPSLIDGLSLKCDPDINTAYA
jgi:hypothetical protein